MKNRGEIIQNKQFQERMNDASQKLNDADEEFKIIFNRRSLIEDPSLASN